MIRIYLTLHLALYEGLHTCLYRMHFILSGVIRPMDLRGIEKLWVREAMTASSRLVGWSNLMMMSEFDALKRISAYIAENKLKASLEAEVQHMDVEYN